jgi:ubiquitin-conjugating enzyme E2 D/E
MPFISWLFQWLVVLDGPADGVYAGGTFFVALDFTDRYPFVPPAVTFLTRIYHSGVNARGQCQAHPVHRDWNSDMQFPPTLFQPFIK